MKKWHISSLLLFLVSAQSARILVVQPSTFYSHQLPLKHIYKELSLRGHKVVAITTSPIGYSDLTNLTEINIAGVSRHVQNVTFAKLYARRGFYTNIFLFFKGLGDVAEDIFADLNVQKLLNDSKEYFDLVIVEWCAHPVFAALSQRFECPLIGFRSMELRPLCHEVIGNPTNPSYIPTGSKDAAYSGFWGRLDNLLVYVGHCLLHRFIMLPRAQNILQKYLKDSSLNVEKAESNVSIVITNTHPILNGVRPVVSNYIQIPGLHLQYTNKSILSEDVAQFLDGATEGAIYLSFGSVVQMNDLVGNELLVLLKVLTRLPYKVLCKLEEDGIAKFSPNIKVVKWVSQTAVLAHKNVKLFITHGGLLSYQEAVYYRVPIVGLPFYGDQFINVNRIVELQIGKRLDFYSLNEATMYATIREVIENPLYKERITAVSNMIKDQEKMEPLDETIWWIEYVLRYKGAQYMNSSAINLNIFQYLLLDVLAFIFIFITFIVYCILKLTTLSKLTVSYFLESRKKLKAG